MGISTYQTAGSIPIATVMTGLMISMSMAQPATQITPDPSRMIWPEAHCSYLLGNAGVTIHIFEGFTGDSVVDNYRPRTELGRKLLALRRAYVMSGGQLLDGDGLDAEIWLRRGGVANA